MATLLRKIVSRQADGFVITLEPNPTGKALVAIRECRRRNVYYLPLAAIFSAAVKASLRCSEPVKSVKRGFTNQSKSRR